MSRPMQMPPPPPLLLTKRVTSFLRANLSPHIHAAMLTTPAGSLLAHASDLPASALRRQCAVAASLWALQRPGDAPSATPAAIPTGSSVTTKKRKHSPPVVTVQLDSGAVFVIRRLRCGMLFICMGGTETGRRTPTPSHHQPQSPSPGTTPTAAAPLAPLASTTTHTSQDPTSNPETPTDPPSTPPPKHQQPHQHSQFSSPLQPSHQSSHQQQPPSNPTIITPATTTPTPPHASSPSESASILSSHTTGAATTASLASSTCSASMMRRQVEELARWLDERLGGLCVPEEGIGIGINTGVGGNGNGVGVGGNGGVGLGVEVR